VTGTCTPPVEPRPLRHGLAALIRHRGFRLAAVAWLAANAFVLAASGDALPFDWPNSATPTAAGRLLDANLAVVEALLLVALVYWMTRKRALPALAERAPERSTAARETAFLVLYGIAGLGLGFVLARLAGWHPFGLHLAGSLHGTDDHVAPAEVIGWASYNLLVYAVIPLAYFRRRYRPEQLNLRSADRRADALLIGVILVLEGIVQIAALNPRLFGLEPGQLAIGVPLTFLLYLVGAVLPAMVFVYAILVPRLLRLTGSAVTTALLGGLAYTALHLWDAWTVVDSPRNAMLSLVFLLFTYAAPGILKTVLTVRTGNAWVHVWAYHALVPHTLVDTPHLVRVFGL
jgi:hypothetical protein